MLREMRRRWSAGAPAQQVAGSTRPPGRSGRHIRAVLDERGGVRGGGREDIAMESRRKGSSPSARPRASYHARNRPTAWAYAARVRGLRISAVKNSTKRRWARSPARSMTAGRWRTGQVRRAGLGRLASGRERRPRTNGVRFQEGAERLLRLPIFCCGLSWAKPDGDSGLFVSGNVSP